MYYKLVIDETARDCLNDTPHMFHQVVEKFGSIEEVKQHLVERYGKMPKGRSIVFIDTKEGGSEVVGFTHSYWNKDVSHNSKSWFQTDWIEVMEVEEKTILII
jgi:hypothetical protein